PKSAFRSAENHRQVHLIFDRDLPLNNRGTVAVENIKDSSGTYINTHKKTFLQDVRSISVNGVGWLNDSTISLVFNKPLVATYSEITANYSVDENVGQPLTAI